MFFLLPHSIFCFHGLISNLLSVCGWRHKQKYFLFIIQVMCERGERFELVLVLIYRHENNWVWCGLIGFGIEFKISEIDLNFFKISISSIWNDTTIIHLLSSRTKKHHKEQKQHKKAWNSRKRELLVKEKRVKNVMTSLWTRSREQQALKAAKYFSINTRREKFYYVRGIWLRKMHEGMLGSEFEGFFWFLKNFFEFLNF